MKITIPQESVFVKKTAFIRKRDLIDLNLQHIKIIRVLINDLDKQCDLEDDLENEQ